jgi:hypothetical protein
MPTVIAWGSTAWSAKPSPLSPVKPPNCVFFQEEGGLFVLFWF